MEVPCITREHNWEIYFKRIIVPIIIITDYKQISAKPEEVYKSFLPDLGWEKRSFHRKECMGRCVKAEQRN